MQRYIFSVEKRRVGVVPPAVDKGGGGAAAASSSDANIQGYIHVLLDKQKHVERHTTSTSTFMFSLWGARITTLGPFAQNLMMGLEKTRIHGGGGGGGGGGG
ncbi:hypothetical protein ACJX0J_024385, partial [Zea mays]